ncbi:MAG: MFS transporter [Victivallales bacterium]|nr:MFS transporter [Victivallales bacterium]
MVRLAIPKGGLKADNSINWKRNLLCVWIGQLLCIAGSSAILPFMPLFIQEKYHVTDEKVLGIWVSLLSFFGLCSFCFSTPIWGVLADKYGRKLMLLRSYYASALLFPLLCFAPSPAWLVVTRFVVSAFSGTNTAAQTLIVSTTPQEHHGLALGALSAAIWSGNMVGFLCGSFLVDALGYVWGFMACGAMYLTGGVVTHIWVREGEEPLPARTENGSWRKCLGDCPPVVWTVMVMFVCLGLARRFDEPYVPMLVCRLAGAEKAVFCTGMVSLAAAVGGLLSGVAMGRLSDRVPTAVLAVPSVLVAALTAVGQGLSQSLWMFGGMRFLHYLSAGGLDPAFQALLSRSTPPERRGALFGFAFSMRMAGILLASLLSGGIIGAAGSVRLVFVVAGLLFLLLLAPIAKCAFAK